MRRRSSQRYLAPPIQTFKTRNGYVTRVETDPHSYMVSSCLFTAFTSSKSWISCITIAPYVNVNSSAFCCTMVDPSSTIHRSAREARHPGFGKEHPRCSSLGRFYRIPNFNRIVDSIGPSSPTGESRHKYQFGSQRDGAGKVTVGSGEGKWMTRGWDAS